MLGFCLGVIASILSVGVGLLIVGRWLKNLPVSCRWGIGGAVGLGTAGIATLCWGLCGWLGHLWPLWTIYSIVGMTGLYIYRKKLYSTLVNDFHVRIIILITILLLLLRLPTLFVPSAGADWDSASHQLAMSKIWLSEGRVTYIPFMHHSNIPATINMLFIHGLQFGEQTGAKTFGFMFGIFALLFVGGLASKQFNSRAGAWASLMLIASPVVLWEIGTAYVDVAHGLYAGGAILLAALFCVNQDKRYLYLSSIFLGFAIGTKYTGFQVALGIVICLLFCANFTASYYRKILKRVSFVSTVIIISFVVGGIWYVRNIVNTGNPVYPFFYSVFGGSNWNEENAQAYAAEQKRFGIGQQESGKDLSSLPGSVTALALQADLHINGAAPWGAVGPMFVVSVLLWLFSGKIRQEITALLLMIGVVLITWFFLTQQSRYIISLLFPACYLAAGSIACLSFRSLAMVGISLQAAYTLFLFGWFGDFQNELRYALFNRREADFLSERIALGQYAYLRFPFFEGTQAINKLSESHPVYVALYDETRGYYLDVPYMWANPGHHTLIPYHKISDGNEWIAELRKLGITHVYVNLDPAFVSYPISNSMIRLFLLGQSDGKDLLGYRKLIADAFLKGKLRLIGSFDTPVSLYDAPNQPPRAFLFEIVD